MPEWLLRESVKVKPGCWKQQDVGHAMAARHLPRTAVDREWNQPKKEKYVAVGKAKWAWPSQPSDFTHGAKGFEVCPDGLWSCFASALHLFPPFWNGQVHSGPLSVDVAI